MSSTSPARPQQRRRAAAVIVGLTLAVGASVYVARTAYTDRIDGGAVAGAPAVRLTPPDAPAPTSPAAPSAGAFPTLTTAGVPAGWSPARTVNGGLILDTPGQVLEDVRVNGTIRVSAANVVIRRVDVVGGSISNATAGCANGLVVENTTIRRGSAATSTDDLPALGDGGYTARNVKIDGLAEGFRVGGRNSGCGPVVIERSYARVVSPDNCGDWHGDGLQGYDGPAVTVRTSVLELVERGGCGGTAPFFYPADQGNTSANVDGLIVIGGGASFRLGTPGSVNRLYVVDGSWFYTPVMVECGLLSSWAAQVVQLDAAGQPVPVRSLGCTR